MKYLATYMQVGIFGVNITDMKDVGTRERIIALGRNLMQDIGYHSFNYKQIANELGIKNASIHHHFPSKEDLAIAVNAGRRIF